MGLAIAKNSLLSMTGLSPMQMVFGRNPEVLGDVLTDRPDLITNGAIVNDPVATLQARVRASERAHQAAERAVIDTITMWHMVLAKIT